MSVLCGRRSMICLLAVAIAGCGGTPQVKYQVGDTNAAVGQATEWTFDTDETGKPPAGAEIFSGTWAVRAEGDAPSPPNVLSQTATAADFPAIRLASPTRAVCSWVRAGTRSSHPAMTVGTHT